MLKKYLQLISFSLLSLSVFAQPDWGNWLMYFGQNRISDKFSIHSEVQFRNHDVLPGDTEQWLLRTGLNYHFAPNAFVTGGYAYVPSYVYDSEQSEPESKEHRIFQQLITTQLIGKFKLEHRYRIEQRWVNSDYRNRFRYRLMATVPLNQPTMDPGAFFFGIYDEVFVNGKATFFDRNRLYFALGNVLNKTTSVQAGILHQQVGPNGKWYLQFAVFYNPDFRRKLVTDD